MINILAVLSVLTIVLRTTLSGIPELFPGGAQIGSVCYDLSLLFISAWIFNLLVVVLLKRSDQRLIFRTVEPLIQGATQGQAFLVMLFAVAGENYIPNRPDREALHRACLGVDPNAQARGGIKKIPSGTSFPSRGSNTASSR